MIHILYEYFKADAWGNMGASWSAHDELNSRLPVFGEAIVTVHGSVCSFCVRLCCGPARCACQRCLVTVHLTR